LCSFCDFCCITGNLKIIGVEERVQSYDLGVNALELVGQSGLQLEIGVSFTSAVPDKVTSAPPGVIGPTYVTPAVMLEMASSRIGSRAADV
jgi:hypothetical protein